MPEHKNERLYELLSEHLTERKRLLFQQIATQRTRHLTLVLEDLYQAQNTSAIQRSLESWGVQDMYIIENTHPFNHHRRVARGAYDWLTVYRYNEDINNTQKCFNDLRERGYQIAVTALHERAVPVQELDISRKTAIVMGTELTGASKYAIEEADVRVVIPTYGFTESLNVGVAAAVLMQNLVERMRSSDIDWKLTPKEQLELRIAWAKKSVSWSKYLVEMFESGELRG